MSDGNLNHQLRESILAALKAQWPAADVVTLNTGADLRWIRPDGITVASSKHRTFVATANTVQIAAEELTRAASEFITDPVAVALYIGGAFWYGGRVYATILYIDREGP